MRLYEKMHFLAVFIFFLSRYTSKSLFCHVNVRKKNWKRRYGIVYVKTYIVWRSYWCPPDCLKQKTNVILHEQHDEKSCTGRTELIGEVPTVVKMPVVKVTTWKRAVNVLWYVQQQKRDWLASVPETVKLVWHIGLAKGARGGPGTRPRNGLTQRAPP